MRPRLTQEQKLHVDNLLNIMSKHRAGDKYNRALKELIILTQSITGEPVHNKTQALLALDYIEPFTSKPPKPMKYSELRQMIKEELDNSVKSKDFQANQKNFEVSFEHDYGKNYIINLKSNNVHIEFYVIVEMLNRKIKEILINTYNTLKGEGVFSGDEIHTIWTQYEPELRRDRNFQKLIQDTHIEFEGDLNEISGEELENLEKYNKELEKTKNIKSNMKKG